MVTDSLMSGISLILVVVAVGCFCMFMKRFQYVEVTCPGLWHLKQKLLSKHPTQHVQVQVQVQVQFNSLKSPHPPVDLTPSRLPPQEPFPSYDHLTVVIISCLPLPSCLTWESLSYPSQSKHSSFGHYNETVSLTHLMIYLWFLTYFLSLWCSTLYALQTLNHQIIFIEFMQQIKYNGPHFHYPLPIGTSSTVIGSMAFLPVPTALIPSRPLLLPLTHVAHKSQLAFDPPWILSIFD